MCPNSRTMCDVEPQQYATLIREMIRHEDDVTNHRIMWLLIAQGLIANAFVFAPRVKGIDLMLPLVGILVTFSTFVILYKSYQARGYLQFLGHEAKLGHLEPEDLPLDGWPRMRIKGWRREIWMCAWIGRASDGLEPYLFLPILITFAWLYLLLRELIARDPIMLLVFTAFSVAAIFSVFCIAWVRSQATDEKGVLVNRSRTTGVGMSPRDQPRST
jgi:hypothetical protein